MLLRLFCSLLMILVYCVFAVNNTISDSSKSSLLFLKPPYALRSNGDILERWHAYTSQVLDI